MGCECAPRPARRWPGRGGRRGPPGARCAVTPWPGPVAYQVHSGRLTSREISTGADQVRPSSALWVTHTVRSASPLRIFSSPPAGLAQQQPDRPRASVHHRGGVAHGHPRVGRHHPRLVPGPGPRPCSRRSRVSISSGARRGCACAPRRTPAPSPSWRGSGRGCGRCHPSLSPARHSSCRSIRSIGASLIASGSTIGTEKTQSNRPAPGVQVRRDPQRGRPGPAR